MKHLRLFTLVLFFVLSLQTMAQKRIRKPVYLFSYFKNNGKDGLHLAYSKDGYNWLTLNNDSSVLVPQVGSDKLMRDPCIIRGADNKFHMTWTVSWKERSIGYASSTDLINWSKQKEIPVMALEPTAKNTWAPEIFYDEETKEYLIYWSTTIPGRFPETDKIAPNSNHRIYYVTTKDFISFSETKVLYGGPTSVIDATIQKVNGTYNMFIKDETYRPDKIKRIYRLSSNSLKDGYGELKQAITGDYNAEGPTLVKIKDDWVMYFDKPLLHQYGACSSKDLETWVDVSDKISIPKGLRHGSIIQITQKEFKNLQNNL